MKSIAKLLLAGVVAIVAIAMSAAPSEAAKKKKAAKPAACTALTMCAANCKGSECQVMQCTDGKWWVVFYSPVCYGTSCPPKCDKI